MVTPVTFTATALALRTKDFVVVAAERRVTYFNMVFSRHGKKIYLVNNRCAVAATGLLSDLQAQVRSLRMWSKYMEVTLGRRLPVRSIAKMLSHQLYRWKTYPYIVQAIVAGYDEEGTHVYALDMLGAITEENYVAIGTGAPIAIGILENDYRSDLEKEEAVKICVDALKACAERDVLSGEGIDIIVLSTDGTIEEKFMALEKGPSLP